MTTMVQNPNFELQRIKRFSFSSQAERNRAKNRKYYEHVFMCSEMGRMRLVFIVLSFVFFLFILIRVLQALDERRKTLPNDKRLNQIGRNVTNLDIIKKKNQLYTPTQVLPDPKKIS